MIILIILGVAILGGFIDILAHPKKPKNVSDKDWYKMTYKQARKYKNEMALNDVVEIPYYIIDKADAYDRCITSYITCLRELQYKISICTDSTKKAQLLKKEAELMLKISNTTEKLDNLKNRYGII